MELVILSQYKYGIHPTIKILFLIALNILAFHPNFSSYRIFVFLGEIGLAKAVRLHFQELWGFFKVLLYNFAALYLLFYFAVLDWLKAFLVFIDYALTTTAMFLAAFIFTKATPPRELIVGLRKLGLPQTFSFAIMIALTFLPMITTKIQEIIAYQQARGYKFNVFKLSPILIPAILSMMDFSTNLAISLKARAFDLKEFE